MTERERLIELLNESTDRNGIYIDKIADYLLANGVIAPPCKVGDMIDKFFSHNTRIALWYEDPTDRHYSNMLWRGMAWNIPKNYKALTFVKFMGIVADNISESDILNIKIELSKEEAEQALKEEQNHD